jgi:hypothetical protein
MSATDMRRSETVTMGGSGAMVPAGRRLLLAAIWASVATG